VNAAFKRAVTVLLAAALSAGIVPSPGLAQHAGSQRLTLSPSVVMLHSKFGQTVSQSITLSNDTERGLSFEMVARDAYVKDGKRLFAPAGQLPHSIAGTAVFSQRSGYVAAFADQTVTVLLTIPSGTAIRAVSIAFKTKNGTVAVGENAVGLVASLGALMTFVLTDNIQLAGGPVRVTPPTASEDLKVSESLENTGTEPYVPQGIAAFVDANGLLAAKVPFGATRLLPGERSTFTADYAGRLRPGAYRVICTFSYESRSLTITGSYRAP
jgi:hypothetical protein